MGDWLNEHGLFLGIIIVVALWAIPTIPLPWLVIRFLRWRRVRKSLQEIESTPDTPPARARFPWAITVLTCLILLPALYTLPLCWRQIPTKAERWVVAQGGEVAWEVDEKRLTVRLLTALDQDGNWSEGLLDLRCMGMINYVDLNDTEVSDLTPISGLTSLVYLSLNSTNVTQAQVDALQKALPHCIIEYTPTTP